MLKDLSDFISNVGFPIVVAIGLYFQQKKNHETFTQIMEEYQRTISKHADVISLLVDGLDKANLINEDIKQKIKEK